MGGYWYYILALGIMIWSFVVQITLQSKAKKGSTMPSNMTANEVVEQMLREHGISGITICHKSGDLTDCYSPRESKIYLSDTTYNQRTVTAVAVAAHECGHAVQDHEGMVIYRVRQFLAPAAGICSSVSVYIVMAGLVVAAVAEHGGDIGYFLCNLGIIVYLVTFLFYLVMLPVERNASSRAYKDMKRSNWVDESDMKYAYKVLRAAGDTYAISLASSVLTLFRLVLLRNSVKGRRR